MTILFVILIIVASFILGLIVLIQNPKGGGLAATFGGLNTQFMGVKQTTDVLEKGTWIFSGVIAALCLLSTFFMQGSATAGQSNNANKVKEAGVPANTQGTQNQQLPGGITPVDSPK